MKKNSKYLLLERMSYLNNDFIFPLNESEDKKYYKQRLIESHRGSTYNTLVEHFSSNNKLKGNIIEDIKYLKEFTLLLEDDDFDPFAHLQLTDKIEEKEDCVLSISKGNAKLNHPIFSLPAGYTCPFANICKSFASKDGSNFASSGMKIKDQGNIRCYAASSEVAYPNVRNSRWKNFDLLQEFKGDVNGMADLIDRSLKYFGSTSLFRIHESGDFYSQEYFDAWLQAIKNHPNINFYAYTKALPFWVARIGEIPSNLKLTASKGGTHDELIDKYDLKQAVIVNTPEEAVQLKLPIDVDDSLAYKSDKSFALLLHGVQSKESGLTPQAKKNTKLVKDLKSRKNS